jgi:hypothetical protein
MAPSTLNSGQTASQTSQNSPPLQSPRSDFVLYPQACCSYIGSLLDRGSSPHSRCSWSEGCSKPKTYIQLVWNIHTVPMTDYCSNSTRWSLIPKGLVGFELNPGPKLVRAFRKSSALIQKPGYGKGRNPRQHTRTSDSDDRLSKPALNIEDPE